MVAAAAGSALARVLTFAASGAPDLAAGMTWEYAGGYNLGRDFDSGFDMF